MEDNSLELEQHCTEMTTRFREVRRLYEDLADTVQRVLKDMLHSAGVPIHSIQARAKTEDSFAKKAAKASPASPNHPKYKNPLIEITDLAAARIITFLPGVIDDVCALIETEFTILEKTDKAEALMDEGKFGYQSIHFLVQLPPARVRLPEYRRFADMTFEIQVRTLLQHAWAEMEHDIQYKSASVIPSVIKRRFIALAGMLELADREFQALQQADQDLRMQARNSVESGQLSDVEITPDALKTYLDQKLGADARQTESTYEYCAQQLAQLGFTRLQQLDDCLHGYDDDAVCRALWGGRQGQITRFEAVLLASMGDVYAKRHPWTNEPYWAKSFPEWIELMRTSGIVIGHYDPLVGIATAPA